ncbi:MAG: hypothetical protein K8H90_04480 [Thermoanaerobaculia bacterium]|nr:hypothetical protein [Thermoanaerobaculia bacterium]
MTQKENESTEGEPAPEDQTVLAAEIEQATLVVLHENRLKNAWMTIWINGDVAWSRPLSVPGGFFARTRGRPVQTAISVPPGLQTIEVRITGAKRKVDATETTSAEFVAGQTRLLRARLIPVVNNLELDWQD